MSKLAPRGAQATRQPAKTSVAPKALARVQSAVSKQHGGSVPKGSYVGRLQQALAKSSK